MAIVTKCRVVEPVLVSSKPPTGGYQQIFNERYSIPSKKGGTIVPNIVHYVSFGINKFQFLNYLSFLSVHKFIRPVVIYVHGDALPYGEWWEKTLKEIPGKWLNELNFRKLHTLIEKKTDP